MDMNHDQLVAALAALPERERQAVVRDAQARAHDKRPTLPWSELRSALGIVQGQPADAVADTDQLYDG